MPMLASTPKGQLPIFWQTFRPRTIRLRSGLTTVGTMDSECGSAVGSLSTLGESECGESAFQPLAFCQISRSSAKRDELDSIKNVNRAKGFYIPWTHERGTHVCASRR